MKLRSALSDSNPPTGDVAVDHRPAPDHEKEKESPDIIDEEASSADDEDADDVPDFPCDSSSGRFDDEVSGDDEDGDDVPAGRCPECGEHGLLGSYCSDCEDSGLIYDTFTYQSDDDEAFQGKGFHAH